MHRHPQQFWEMIEICEAIVDGDGSDDHKQSACLALLRQYLDKRAIRHFGRPDVELRLYLDMVVLRYELVRLLLRSEALVKLAVLPMFRHVLDWLESNPKNRGEAISR